MCVVGFVFSPSCSVTRMNTLSTSKRIMWMSLFVPCRGEKGIKLYVHEGRKAGTPLVHVGV